MVRGGRADAVAEELRDSSTLLPHRNYRRYRSAGPMNPVSPAEVRRGSPEPKPMGVGADVTSTGARSQDYSKGRSSPNGAHTAETNETQKHHGRPESKVEPVIGVIEGHKVRIGVVRYE